MATRKRKKQNHIHFQLFASGGQQKLEFPPDNSLSWQEVEYFASDFLIFKDNAREMLWRKWVWRLIEEEGLAEFDEPFGKFKVYCRFITVCQILYEFSDFYYNKNYSVAVDDYMPLEMAEKIDPEIFAFMKEYSGLDFFKFVDRLYIARAEIHKLLMKKYSYKGDQSKTIYEIFYDLISVHYPNADILHGQDNLTYDNFFLHNGKTRQYSEIKDEHLTRTLEWIRKEFY